MPYTRTAKGWSDEALQPNSATNLGRDTQNKPSFWQADTAPGKSIAQAKNRSDTNFSHAELLERLADATDADLQDEAWLLETETALADAFFSSTSMTCCDWLGYPPGEPVERRHWWFSGQDGWQQIEDAPNWLHSVDAALTLLSILREHWYLEHISDNRWLGDGSGFRVKLWRPTQNAMVTAHADTLPVAICIACLRASVGEGA